ncbi:MAG: substrate-binding domain-containing protein [Acidobacteriota bacterium]
MMLLKRIPLILLYCAFLLATNGTALAQEIKVGAGVAPVENIFKPIKEPFEKVSGIKLTIIDNGPVNALKDLDKGVIDIASGALPFNEWMNMMEESGYKISDRSIYKYRVVGRDSVKVIMHNQNRISSLSKEQLKGIFTGKFTNWKEVGGKDLPIVVIFGKLIPGTNKVFQLQIMDNAPYTAKFIEATTGPDIRQKVSQTPGAIGLGAMSIVNDQIFSPKTPDVRRPIVVITKARPSANVEKLLEYIKGEGQKYTFR